MALDISKIRKEFPILSRKVYDKDLIYFDSAASSQKVLQVLKKEEQLHLEYYGNIHRGAHYMADKVTAEFEEVRDLTKEFINASSREEIIFTKGTTESINLVASSFGDTFVAEGDEILVSEMEHHSNIIPWQLMAQRRKAKVVMLPFDNDGRLQIEKLDEFINSKTSIIAVTHVSNTLGTINPVREIINKAHQSGIKVLIDGAQAVNHFPVDIQELDADFYAFSAHKMYGPNGVGVLYGKKRLMNQLLPYQGGGEMISEVSFLKTTYNELPYKFEAGTPNITGVISFGEAIRFLKSLGMQEVADHDALLLKYCTEKLRKIQGMTIYGNREEKAGVISFNIDGIHPYDIGVMLDKMAIACRTGRLCADPVMDHYKIPAAVRISFGVYNTVEEVDNFIETLNKVVTMF